MDDVYYKIYKSIRMENKLTVVCVQWFDEFSYDQTRFFKDRHGKELIFHDEKEAINWLLENIKEEFIDDQYLESKVLKDVDYYKN